jgi:hypothetical protein
MSAIGDLFDHATTPATGKQIEFARRIATRIGVKTSTLPVQDRQALSRWIDAHKNRGASAHPSSKQVAFAERIARLKRREIPDECFRDRGLMSRWIDCNKPS